MKDWWTTPEGRVWLEAHAPGWKDCSEPGCQNKVCLGISDEKCFVHTPGWLWWKRIKLKVALHNRRVRRIMTGTKREKEKGKWPEQLSGVRFKVWAEVERADYENDTYERVSEPEELGSFDTQEEAERMLSTLKAAFADY